jgi:glycosyltransferase involved in cell wall biosynthesis
MKGFDCFIRAARALVNSHPNVHFAIAGEGPMRSHLAALIHELDLDDRFSLCGFKSDVASFLSALDIYVCSSLWEGGPITLVEAILMRKPVISTRVGLAPEILRRGDDTAPLAPPGDPAALAALLSRAIVNGTKLMANREAARQKALALTDPVRSAHRIDGVLTFAASKGNGAHLPLNRAL